MRVIYYILMFIFGFFGIGNLAADVEQWLTGGKVAPVMVLTAVIFVLLAWVFMKKARAAA